MSFLDDLLKMGSIANVQPAGDIGPFGSMELRRPPKPKGMFGIKGTPRDILGVLGDAFLVQSGNDPVYRPQQERERLTQSMEGFMDDPLTAIKRVAERNPEAAYEMYNKYLEQQSQLEEDQRSIEEHGWKGRKYDDDHAEAVDENDLRTAAVMSDMYDAVRKNPESWPMMREQMLRYAQRRGYELPADLPEAFDPNLNLQTWAISPKDEVSLARQAALAQNTISNTEFDNQVSGALAENTITNTQEDNEREDANTTSLITDRERDNDRSDKYPPNSGGRGGRRAPPGGKQAPAASNKVPAGLPAVTTKDNGRRMRYKTTGEIWTVRNGKWTKE